MSANGDASPCVAAMRKSKTKFAPGKGLDASNSGVNYFKGSKVGSSRGYVTVAGTILAIPHKRRSQTPVERTRFDGQTEYMKQFQEQNYCYCSMDKKPLTPYDPLAYRSRIAVEDAPVPYKNASIVDFHDGIHTCHKKRFDTQNRTFHTGEPCDPRSNQGILAENTRFRHTLMAR